MDLTSPSVEKTGKRVLNNNIVFLRKLQTAWCMYSEAREVVVYPQAFSSMMVNVFMYIYVFYFRVMSEKRKTDRERATTKKIRVSENIRYGIITVDRRSSVTYYIYLR
jgi:hypothetical protein